MAKSCYKQLTWHFRERLKQRCAIELCREEVVAMIEACNKALLKKPVMPGEQYVKFDVYLKHSRRTFVAVYCPSEQIFVTAYRDDRMMNWSKLDRELGKDKRRRERELLRDHEDAKYKRIRLGGKIKTRSRQSL